MAKPSQSVSHMLWCRDQPGNLGGAGMFASDLNLVTPGAAARTGVGRIAVTPSPASCHRMQLQIRDNRRTNGCEHHKRFGRLRSSSLIALVGHSQLMSKQQRSHRPRRLRPDDRGSKRRAIGATVPASTYLDETTSAFSASWRTAIAVLRACRAPTALRRRRRIPHGFVRRAAALRTLLGTGLLDHHHARVPVWC